MRLSLLGELIILRQGLDRLVGVTKRYTFFEALFSMQGHRVALYRGHTEADAERISEGLRDLGLDASVAPTTMFPNYFTVWVEI